MMGIWRLCASFAEFLSGDSRNPSCVEGGDVGLSARTSTHILVFAFDYLSILYSFISRITIIIHPHMPDIVLTLVSLQESY